MGEEFQRVAVFPVGVSQLEKIATFGGAGIVDQNVEAAELALRLLDQLSRRVGFAQIGDGDGDAVAVLADRRGHLFERFLVAAGQHHVAALGGERQRHTTADAAARSGHQRDLAFPPRWRLARSPMPGSRVTTSTAFSAPATRRDPVRRRWPST